jgi:hypothetical protein
MSAATRLTKTGQPVMGTTIEVLLADDTWQAAKVVGKGYGRDGQKLVMVIVEWGDGEREILHGFGEVVWRSVPKAAR